MTLASKLIGAASVPALLAGLAVPALAQTSTQPSTMTVPNSATQVQCNANGTATVTSGSNAQTSTANSVPGTPVTQNNPSGTGTTTTQTPALTKGTNATTAQCPKVPATTVPQQTAPAAAPQTMGNGPAGTQMDALNNNPNGSNWLAKFDRPVQPPSYAHTKVQRKHHVKRASGGGGH